MLQSNLMITIPLLTQGEIWCYFELIRANNDLTHFEEELREEVDTTISVCLHTICPYCRSLYNILKKLTGVRFVCFL